MWKHLLLPLDFSECANRALEVALALAAREQATVTLFHVTPLPPNLPADALVTPPGAATQVRIDEYTTRGVRVRLETFAESLRQHGIDVRTVAVAAASMDVAGEILRATRELEADAIVVGTHGRTGLSHLLLGSVAEKVIRGAAVPVISIRSSAPEAVPIREERVAEDELSG